MLVSVFPQTYQRFMARCCDAEAPELVVLFHPGLDVHYFAWYACLKYWVESRVPVLITAYCVPGGLGEKPDTVRCLLETLVGAACMWVTETDNPHAIEDGSFNAAYFVILGSAGALPTLPEDMYWFLQQALQKVGHPFAPRVGYLDVEADEGKVASHNLRLMAAIAEGAIRGAMAGEDPTDEDTARGFAIKVLDDVIGPGAGKSWGEANIRRESCANCGEGYDSREQHLWLCPAVGICPLAAGDSVRLARLKATELNGKDGTLEGFDRVKQRWVVKLSGRPALFKSVNLELAS